MWQGNVLQAGCEGQAANVVQGERAEGAGGVMLLASLRCAISLPEHLFG
jgi:hypothetical protein